jgi:hypothetical protein
MPVLFCGQDVVSNENSNTPEPGAEAAFLSFMIGPVQPFIESARTLRDLWSGSYLLSWLTASAMVPNFRDRAMPLRRIRGTPIFQQMVFDFRGSPSLHLGNLSAL